MNVSMLLVIVVLACVIVTSVFFFQTKETFNTKQISAQALNNLNNTFGQASCSSLALNNNSPPIARQNASSYIETNRFRKWKPALNSNNADPNGLYCYVNNDMSRNEQDYFMSGGHKCSITDTNFNNIPFITDVFSDSMPQTTNTAPNNKCVFKIDPSQITHDSLVDFWQNRVAPSECIKQYSYILDLNDSLTKQRNYLISASNQVSAYLTNLISTVAWQNQEITKLSKHLETLQTSNAQMLNTITFVDEENSIIQSRIINAKEECSKSKTYWNIQLDSCNTQCNMVREEWQPISQDLNKLHIDMASFQIKFDGLTTNINTHNNLLQNANIIYNNLETKYNTLVPIENKCQADLSECLGTLDNCEASLILDLANEKLQQDKYNTCKSDLDICNGLYSVCISTSNALNYSTRKYQGLTAQCINDKTTCLRDVGIAEANITTNNQEYTFAQEYYNALSCQELINEAASLNAQYSYLKENCQRARTRADSLQATITTTIANEQATQSQQLETCKTDVNNSIKEAAARKPPKASYNVVDFVQMTMPGTDLPGQPMIGSLMDCQTACDTQSCVGFSRMKSAADGSPSECYLKQQITSDVTWSDPTWQTWQKG